MRRKEGGVEKLRPPKPSAPGWHRQRRPNATPGVPSHTLAPRPPIPTSELTGEPLRPRSRVPGGRGDMAALRGQGESGPRAPRPRHQRRPRPRPARPVFPSTPEWSGPGRAALRTRRHGGPHHCRGVGGTILSSAAEGPPLKENSGSSRKPGLRLPRRPTAPRP